PNFFLKKLTNCSSSNDGTFAPTVAMPPAKAKLFLICSLSETYEAVTSSIITTDELLPFDFAALILALISSTILAVGSLQGFDALYLLDFGIPKSTRIPKPTFSESSTKVCPVDNASKNIASLRS